MRLHCDHRSINLLSIQVHVSIRFLLADFSTGKESPVAAQFVVQTQKWRSRWATPVFTFFDRIMELE